MKYEGWEVYELSEQDFSVWTRDEKISNIKGWLKEAKLRQAATGLIDAEYIPPI